MVSHLVYFRLGVIETVVFFNPHLGHLNILVDLEPGMLQDFLDAGYRAPVDPHDHFGGLSRFDHSAHVTPNAGQAIHSADFILGQFQPRQVGDLSYVGAAGAGKNQNLVWLARAFFFHGFILSLLNHFLDLFHRRKLPGHFYGPIHRQGRGDHHPIAADLFDVFYLYDFGFDTEFFDRLLGSILELVALRSTHSQHFNFFHRLLLFYFMKFRNSP
jgi:hypothetical protein